MQRGDILLNHIHHVAMYCGNGKEVETSINERRRLHVWSKDGQKGEKGNHVLLVQEVLKARGLKGKDGKDLKLDKDCGANVEHAIKQYQKVREKVDPGICGGVDGIAGEKTLRDMIALWDGSAFRGHRNRIAPPNILC